MANNPYNYQRYLDALRPPERRAVVSGSISLINEINDRRQEAEEVMRRQIFYDYYGGVHRSREEMWAANAWIERSRGRQACQRMLDDLP
jgi:hypothetical protein